MKQWIVVPFIMCYFCLHHLTTSSHTNHRQKRQPVNQLAFPSASSHTPSASRKRMVTFVRRPESVSLQPFIDSNGNQVSRVMSASERIEVSIKSPVIVTNFPTTSPPIVPPEGLEVFEDLSTVEPLEMVELADSVPSSTPALVASSSNFASKQPKNPTFIFGGFDDPIRVPDGAPNGPLGLINDNQLPFLSHQSVFFQEASSKQKFSVLPPVNAQASPSSTQRSLVFEQGNSGNLHFNFSRLNPKIRKPVPSFGQQGTLNALPPVGQIVMHQNIPQEPEKINLLMPEPVQNHVMTTSAPQIRFHVTQEQNQLPIKAPPILLQNGNGQVGHHLRQGKKFVPQSPGLTNTLTFQSLPLNIQQSLQKLVAPMQQGQQQGQQQGPQQRPIVIPSQQQKNNKQFQGQLSLGKQMGNSKQVNQGFKQDGAGFVSGKQQNNRFTPSTIQGQVFAPSNVQSQKVVAPNSHQFKSNDNQQLNQQNGNANQQHVTLQQNIQIQQQQQQQNRHHLHLQQMQQIKQHHEQQLRKQQINQLKQQFMQQQHQKQLQQVQQQQQLEQHEEQMNSNIQQQLGQNGEFLQQNRNQGFQQQKFGLQNHQIHQQNVDQQQQNTQQNTQQFSGQIGQQHALNNGQQFDIQNFQQTQNQQNDQHQLFRQNNQQQQQLRQQDKPHQNQQFPQQNSQQPPQNQQIAQQNHQLQQNQQINNQQNQQINNQQNQQIDNQQNHQINNQQFNLLNNNQPNHVQQQFMQQNNQPQQVQQQFQQQNHQEFNFQQKKPVKFNNPKKFPGNLQQQQQQFHKFQQQKHQTQFQQNSNNQLQTNNQITNTEPPKQLEKQVHTGPKTATLVFDSRPFRIVHNSLHPNRHKIFHSPAQVITADIITTQNSIVNQPPNQPINQPPNLPINQPSIPPLNQLQPVNQIPQQNIQPLNQIHSVPVVEQNGLPSDDDLSNQPTAEDPDADGIVGLAGVNYPTYSHVFQTGFKCHDKPALPGIYADMDAQCQMYHSCEWDGTKTSFLCSPGTVFNQKYLICDWWYNVNCNDSPNFYNVNAISNDVSRSDQLAANNNNNINTNNLNQFVHTTVDQIASSTQLDVATVAPPKSFQGVNDLSLDLPFEFFPSAFSNPSNDG